jgi:hypothetical protein
MKKKSLGRIVVMKGKIVPAYSPIVSRLGQDANDEIMRIFDISAPPWEKSGVGAAAR